MICANSITKLDIETEKPPLDVALYYVLHEIEVLQNLGGVIKIIHGYGSSGTGGVIKNECHKLLIKLKKARTPNRKNVCIREYIKGEEFFPTNSKYIRWVEDYPILLADEDLARGNGGVTFVIV